MFYLKRYFLFFLCLAALPSLGKSQGQPSPKKYKFSVSAGGGPNYYFNNLVTGKDRVSELNYSFITRIMWEPEHRLSLGIETGYIRLYTFHSTNPTEVHIVNSVVPIQTVVAMNFVKSLYGILTMGPSVLSNKVTTSAQGDFDGSALSLADLSGTLEYRFNWKERLRYSVGAKYYYSSHLNDKNITLLFMLGYRF